MEGNPFRAFAEDAAKAALSGVIDGIDNTPYIVSVGCGTARTEMRLMGHFQIPRRRLLLVDPDPLSFTSSGDALAAKIDYAYTKDLVRALPSVEGNCALILWYTDPDYAFYDMEAIHMLKPRMVLIAYEANFTASSLLVQAWLRSLGLSGDSAYPTEMLPGPERWFPPKGEYSVSFQRDSALKDKYGCARNRIVLLSRNVTQQPWTEANFTLFEQEFYEDISSQELLKKLINRRI